MRVPVKNMRGKPLSPCTQRTARLLLRDGKAKIISYRPFAIQLCIPTGETVQEVNVAIDEGSHHVGVAVTSGDKVLMKGDIELRQDISSLLKTRADLRRNRRQRKTRYRQPRWRNRRRKDGWLPPSLNARKQATFHWIDKLCSLLPNPKLHIEVGKFDTQKMINPNIKGVDYQHGQTYGYEETRYFVFARDGYQCQACKKHGKILRTHHIIYRSEGGSDRADNLITVCTDCHTSENHKPGGVFWKWMKKGKRPAQYKEPPFMNAMRLATIRRYPNARITYGSETTPHRKGLGLEKTHYNDAIAISGIESIKSNPSEVFHIRQVRSKKRSLHEATARKGKIDRKTGIRKKNTTQKRNKKNTREVNGWRLNDKVSYCWRQGWISGFTGSKSYVIDANGNYVVKEGKKGKAIPFSQLHRHHHNNNWICYVTNKET